METQPEGPWTQKLEGVLHMYLNKIWDWDFFEMGQQNADRSFVNACTGPAFYHQRVLSTSARRTRVDEIEDQSTGVFVHQQNYFLIKVGKPGKPRKVATK